MRQLGNPVITDGNRDCMDEPVKNRSAAAWSRSCSGLGSKVPSSDAEVANLKTDLIRAGFRSENALAGVLRNAHHGHAGDAGAAAS